MNKLNKKMKNKYNNKTLKINHKKNKKIKNQKIMNKKIMIKRMTKLKKILQIKMRLKNKLDYYKKQEIKR